MITFALNINKIYNDMDIKNAMRAYLTSKKINLSNSRIDEYVSKLQKRISEEDDVNEKIAEFDELFDFAEIARTDDRLRTLERKSTPNTEQKDKEEENKPNPQDDLLQKLLEEVQSLKAEKKQETLKERFFSDERLKGIDKKFLERYVPKDEDAFDTEIESATSLWNELKMARYGNDAPPASSGSPKTLSEKEIQEKVNKINKGK